MSERNDQIAGLIARSIAAVGVAFAASLVPLAVYENVESYIKLEGFWYQVTFALVGFCGVTSGTFWLPRWSRLFASPVLLAIGLLFYCLLRTPSASDGDEEVSIPDTWWIASQFLPLVVGGLFSVVLFFFLPSDLMPMYVKKIPTNDACEGVNEVY